MLTITSSQLNRLAEAATRRFASDLASYVADRCGGKFSETPIEELREMCWRGVERGRAFGLGTKRHLRVFVEVGLILGPGYFELPTVRMLLGHPDLSGDEKVGFLLAAADELGARQQIGPIA